MGIHEPVFRIQHLEVAFGFTISVKQAERNGPTLLTSEFLQGYPDLVGGSSGSTF